MNTKQKMITRLKNGHVIKQTLCGEIHEILLGAEYTPNIAIAFNTEPTTTHYKNNSTKYTLSLTGIFF